MKIRAAFGRYFHLKKYGPYLLIAAVAGTIPAVSIRLRGDLIDGASSGGTGGSHRFFLLLGLIIALSLLQTVSAASIDRISQRHKIKQSACLDAARLEKASKIAFPITESVRFHALWQSSAEAPELEAQVFRAVGTLVELFVKLALSLFVLWSMDAWTAMGIILLLTAGVFLNRKLAQKTEGFWAKYQENMRRANYFSSLLMQREYAAERKIFSFDEEIDRRYRDSFSRAKGENAKLGRERFQIETVMQILFAFYAVIVALLLLRPLLSGRITMGLFTSAFYAAVGLEQSCKQIYAAVYELVGAAGKMGSLFDFLALEEETGREDIGPDAQIRSVEFRDVTFTYPGMKKPVLRHISFHLEPGRHYALVGENGCGKSTLVKLFVGLYRPDSGQILINGRPAHELSPASRQRLYSVVFQDFYRYPLTIRENVSLCMDAQADDKTLNGVFDRLGAHPMAAMGEAGYDRDLMPLFKDGAGLSGGEWQKMAVARCILSKAPIAILDEPNAALDPMAEASVYTAYRRLLDQRTTLLISHRLGSVRMADEILVLKDGALIAKAKHEKLMETCAYYAELFNMQKGMYM